MNRSTLPHVLCSGFDQPDISLTVGEKAVDHKAVVKSACGELRSGMQVKPISYTVSTLEVGFK